MPSTQGPLTLSDLTSKGAVLLAFYSKDNAPTCVAELELLKEDYALIKQMGVQVVGVSADDLDTHRRFEDKLGGLPFPLACDENLEVARAYEVVDETGNRSRQAIFIIDKAGNVIHSEPWFKPGNPNQYADIFQAIGFG